MTPDQKVEMLRAAMHKALHAKSFEDAGQTMARALAATAELSTPDTCTGTHYGTCGIACTPDARRAELLRWVGIYGEHCIRAGRSLTASRFYTDDDLTERAQNILKAMPTLAALLEAK